MTLQILVLRKYLKCLYSGAVKTWTFALMGDSENSDDDDNDNEDRNESGSVFGKQCSASFKANKTESPGEPVGHRNCLQRVVVPAALFRQSSNYDYTLSNTFPISVEPQIFIFMKSEAKQSNHDLPTISTTANEEKNPFIIRAALTQEPSKLVSLLGEQ